MRRGRRCCCREFTRAVVVDAGSHGDEIKIFLFLSLQSSECASCKEYRKEVVNELDVVVVVNERLKSETRLAQKVPSPALHYNLVQVCRRRTSSTYSISTLCNNAEPYRTPILLDKELVEITSDNRR
jgi:hypothetical protein